MGRTSIVMLLVVCACGPRTPASASSTAAAEPARTASPAPATAEPSAPPAGTVASGVAPSAPPPVLDPIPKERFEPARRFVQKAKLDIYTYHERRIGNREGYLAPIIVTSDGGFLVVATRQNRVGGKFHVGSSRPVVVKLDATGKPSWERAYRTTGFLDYEAASAVELEDGYVVYILSYVHPARGAVVRLLRLDQNGGVVWDLKLRGQGRENTPFAQNVQLHEGQLLLDGHIYKDSSDTAYGWKGRVSLDGKLISDEVGAANPYSKR